MRFQFFIIIFVLSLMPFDASADDAPLHYETFISGSFSLIEGGGSDIDMVSERVEIELGNDAYTVDATFEFMNEGDTATVLVGFPDYGYGYGLGSDSPGRFTGVRTKETFETWVNGQPCNFRDMPGKITVTVHDEIKRDEFRDVVFTNPDSLDALHTNLWKGQWPFEDISVVFIEELRWLVKEVTFPAGESTVTRVRYTEQYSSIDSQGFLEYLYGTGRAWKGTIGRAEFVVKTSPEMWMSREPRFNKSHSLSMTNNREYEKRRLGEFEFEYVLTDVEPMEGDVFLVFVEGRDWESQAERWRVHGDEMYSRAFVLKEEYLNNLPLARLRLLRNTFYAIHGKIFSEPDLDAYFRKTEWYKPREEFREGDLTTIEQENVRKIIEKERWLNNPG